VLGGPIRFQAQLSGPAAWTVTVANSNGATVAHGSGHGNAVDWTWSSPAGKASYTWTISAPHALSATGTLGAATAPPPPPPPAALTITALAVSPSVFTPATDGTFAAATVTFTLSGAAQLAAQVLDASNNVVATPFDQPLLAGAGSFTFDPTALPDGRYTLDLAATPEKGNGATASVPIVVDRTLSGLAVAPGVDGTTALSFTLSQAVAVRVEVQQRGVAVATLYDGTLGTGSHTLVWDGTDGSGGLLPAGTYTLVLVLTDALGEVELPVQIQVPA
jgi:flagellar hook assembly protein FlgD